MPLQNRVDPYGALSATRTRGAWMGNRGVLHDASKQVVAAWRLRRWITCVLSFKDRRREVFAPKRYSELFFLDEATSLAPGIGPARSAGGGATRSSAARGTLVSAGGTREAGFSAPRRSTGYFTTRGWRPAESRERTSLSSQRCPTER